MPPRKSHAFEEEPLGEMTEVMALPPVPPPPAVAEIVVEGVVLPAPDGEAHARTVQLTEQGPTYEHVGEDAEGRWVYRHLG